MTEGEESGVEGTSLGRRGFAKGVAGGLVGAGLASRVPDAEAQSSSAGDEIWRFETGDSVESSPTVVDGTVYIGSSSVYAVGALSGDEEWRFKTDYDGNWRKWSSPTVVDGTVYIINSDSGVYALNASDGTEQWRYQRGNLDWSSNLVHLSPTVADGTVYVGSLSSNIYALDVSDGTKLWDYEIGSWARKGSITSSPTIVDNTLYITGDNGDIGNVYALDVSDGTKRWKQEAGPVTSSPTVVDGTVYVGSEDGKFYALDSSDGTVQWRYNTGSSVSSSPTVLDGTVYFCSGSFGSGGAIYALDSSDGDGESVHQTEKTIYSSPTVVDGNVYVGSSDRNLYSLDMSSGEVVWTFQTHGYINSSPTVVDGTVYVGSSDGNLYAVDAGVSGSSEGSRVLQGTLGHHNSFAEQGPLMPSEYDDDDSSESTGDGGTANTDSNTTETNTTSDVGAEGTNAETPDTDTESTDTPDEGGDMGITTVAGALAAVGVVGYGGYKLVGGGDTEDETDDTDPSQKRSGTTGSTTEADEMVREIRGRISKAEEALSSGNPEQTLSEAKDVMNEAETLYKKTGRAEMAQEFTDKSNKLLNQAREMKKEQKERKERRRRIPSKITKAEKQLDKAESKIEGNPQRALKLLSPISNNIESLREDAAEFDELQERVKELEKRHDEINQKAEQEKRSNREQRGTRSGGSGTPTSRSEGSPTTKSPVDAPDLFIEYGGITDKEPIGSGGNADVYRATYDGETIALKEPRMSGTLHTETAERMMQEAETWDRLDDHDHIVSVIDYGSEPLPWIAMEYMDGGHIGEQAGSMNFDRALWTAIATTEGVLHAHRQGVAHLDIKTENVLFRSIEDAWDVPKVADWGLSKHLLNHSKSVEGMSPHYAAPEQFDDSYGSTDDVTDVYQLGAVFYELFTGRPPFEGQSFEIMNKIQNEEPTPPSKVADVPEELDEVLLTALATDKSDRYEHVLYLRDRLQEIR